MVGLASSVLFDRENPYNPINRRISIIVMTKSAEATALSTDAPDVEAAREAIESGKQLDALPEAPARTGCRARSCAAATSRRACRSRGTPRRSAAAIAATAVQRLVGLRGQPPPRRAEAGTRARRAQAASPRIR